MPSTAALRLVARGWAGAPTQETFRLLLVPAGNTGAYQLQLWVARSDGSFDKSLRELSPAVRDATCGLALWDGAELSTESSLPAQSTKAIVAVAFPAGYLHAIAIDKHNIAEVTFSVRTVVFADSDGLQFSLYLTPKASATNPGRIALVDVAWDEQPTSKKDHPEFLAGLVGHAFFFPHPDKQMPALSRVLGLALDKLAKIPGQKEVAPIIHFRATAALAARAQCALEFYAAYALGEKAMGKVSDHLDPFGLPSLLREQPSTEVAILRQWQPQYEDLADAVGRSRWLVAVEIPAAAGVRWWNERVVQPLLTSVQQVEGGRPVSFLPLLGDLLPTQRWQAGWVLLDRKVAGKKGPTTDFSHNWQVATTQTAPTAESLYARHLSLLPASPADLVNPVRATFEGLKTEQSSLRHEVTASLSSLGEDPFVSDDTRPQRREQQWLNLAAEPSQYGTLEARPGAFVVGCGFRELQAAEGPARPGPTVRMQGLRLGLPLPPNIPATLIPTAEAPSLLAAEFEINFHSSPIQRPSFLSGFTANLTLAVRQLEAGGQDDIPGAEFDAHRTTSLVVPLPSASRPSGELLASKPAYLLEVREEADKRSSHELILTLRNTQAEQPFVTDVAVLDFEPFSVARVTTDAPVASDATTNALATWAFRPGEGYGWALRLENKPYSLWLPPQALGEELHRRAGDLQPGAPAGLRFGHATELRLYPAEQYQRFAELPWNLRRRLGYPGQRVPGAWLQGMHVELLYGLRFTLNWQGSSALRLAEVQARLGSWPAPGRVADSEADGALTPIQDRYARAWSELRQRLLSRPAVWEPYRAPAQPEAPGTWRPLELGPADGLTARLDEQADLAYPVAGPAPINLAHPTGLKGSFAWAFESANIYQQLWRNPLATAAELRSLLLSSLGGWGQLRVAFAGGNHCHRCLRGPGTG